MLNGYTLYNAKFIFSLDIANCALQPQSQMHKNINLAKHNKYNVFANRNITQKPRGYPTNTGILMIYFTISYTYKNDLLQKTIPIHSSI